MAMRNGIIGDVYRRAGIECYDIIFGLTLPQMAEIAREFGSDAELAARLWADVKVRESRILSMRLWPQGSVSQDKLDEMIAEAQTREEADCLRLYIKP